MSGRVPKKDDEGPELFCICQQPYDSRRFMIGCDNCDGWFHARCVNITVAEAERLGHFICPPCKARRKRKESSKDRRKDKKSSKGNSGRLGSMSSQYRPPARKPSTRIQRQFRTRYEGEPYEPNFDTEDEDELEAELCIGLEDEDEESDASADVGFSSKERTLAIDVHSYKICHEDLGTDLLMQSLNSDKNEPSSTRDKRLFAHLRRRAFEIECELHRTESREQIMKSGIAFARRATAKHRLEQCYQKALKGEDEKKKKSDTVDPLIHGINNVSALREVCEHNIKCKICQAYIPVKYFAAHLAECAMLSVMRSRPTVDLRPRGRIRKRKADEMRQDYDICGCPLVDPADEPEGKKAHAKVENNATMDSEETVGGDGKAAAQGKAANEMDVSVKKEGGETRVAPGEGKGPTVAKTESGNGQEPAPANASMATNAFAASPMEEKKVTRSVAAAKEAGKLEIIADTLVPVNTRGAVTVKYKGYCTKLRSQCMEHMGWIALWTAEIAQQKQFHEKRLQLVMEEIESVRRASEERRMEIEQAKSKTETADADRRADVPQLEGRGAGVGPARPNMQRGGPMGPGARGSSAALPDPSGAQRRMQYSPNAGPQQVGRQGPPQGGPQRLTRGEHWG